jgi:hypothetical protein
MLSEKKRGRKQGGPRQAELGNHRREAPPKAGNRKANCTYMANANGTMTRWFHKVMTDHRADRPVLCRVNFKVTQLLGKQVRCSEKKQMWQILWG